MLKRQLTKLIAINSVGYKLKIKGEERKPYWIVKFFRLYPKTINIY